MARLFNDSSSQYLTLASAVLTETPISVSAWFNKNNTGDDDTVFVLSDGGSTNYIGILLNNSAGSDQFVRARVGSEYATTSTEYLLNTWHHAMGVFASSTSRSAYLDGGGKDTDTTSVTPSGINQTDIARHPGFGLYLSGAAAEIAVWNVALTDAEVTILALGYSPLMVRPQSLVMYVPLIRDNDEDIIGGRSFTAVNSPTITAHPPVLYPAPPLFTVPAAAPVGGAMPMAFHYYQTMRA